MKDLEHLEKLRSVELGDNNIPVEILEQIGIKNPYSSRPENEYLIDIKKVIEYCQKNS